MRDKNGFNDYWFSESNKEEVLEMRAEQKLKTQQELKEDIFMMRV